MPITATAYMVTCDVKGCEASEPGTLEQLQSNGWRTRHVYAGVPRVGTLRGNYPGHTICGQCVEEKNFIKLERKRDVDIE